MSITQETPDSSRKGGASALDFMYWVLTNTEATTPRNVAVRPFEGSEYDEVEVSQLVSRAAFLCGLDFPGNITTMRQRIFEAGTYITPLTAIRMRGALLFKNRGVAISLGDGRRIMERTEGVFTVRHLLQTEKDDTFWDAAATIPGMRYL